MVDPYAPPMDGSPPAARPPASPGPLTSTYEAPPYHESSRPRPDRPWRDTRDHDRDRERDREPRTEPARPGVFWVVAAIGVGLLALARLVLYFAVADDLDGDASAPAFLGVLGIIALSVGLALAGLLQRGLATPWRIALMLGAGFFAVVGWGPLGPAGFPL